MVVLHSAVAAHQTCAILCLSLLKELAEKLGEREGGEGGRDGKGRCGGRGWEGAYSLGGR